METASNKFNDLPNAMNLKLKIISFINAHKILVPPIVWRLDEMPRNGRIVVVAYGSQPLRWAYLPEGATRLDVESAFTQGYRWYKSVDCQATISKETKIIDHWRFTVLPAAVTHAG